MSSDKKRQQLGMNPSTARSRLVQDVLWMLIEKSGMNVCHQCGEPMCRDTFSIEHKDPWLDSDDPIAMYFDLQNVGFSHQGCNSGAARRPHKHATREIAYQKKLESNQRSKQKLRVYDPQERAARYQRIGS